MCVQYSYFIRYFDGRELIAIIFEVFEVTGLVHHFDIDVFRSRETETRVLRLREWRFPRVLEVYSRRQNQRCVLVYVTWRKYIIIILSLLSAELAFVFHTIPTTKQLYDVDMIFFATIIWLLPDLKIFEIFPLVLLLTHLLTSDSPDVGFPEKSTFFTSAFKYFWVFFVYSGLKVNALSEKIPLATVKYPGT